MKIIAVLIKSPVFSSAKELKILKDLKLTKKFRARIIEDSPSARGLLKDINHLITYGPVKEEELKTLDKYKVAESVYALHPPRGGLRGTKSQYKFKGSLGEREEMTSLLERMA